MDLDQFKLINDTRGHEVGDRLLNRVSQRLIRIVGKMTPVARLGGDEFGLLLVDMEQEELSRLIEQILYDFSRPFIIDSNQLYTSVSIGVAQSLPRYVSSDELIRDADIALYRAKDRGKNRYVRFEQEMHDQLVETSELERDLQHAIENNELTLSYQPVID